jgi:hypothetical protein
MDTDISESTKCAIAWSVAGVPFWKESSTNIPMASTWVSDSSDGRLFLHDEGNLGSVTFGM